MSTPSKKPGSAGVNRLSNSDASSPQTSPSRHPPRASTPTSNTPTRRGSLRNGAPVSARSAMARRESLLGNTTTEAQKQAREEATAAMEDLKERLAKSEGEAENSRKQLEVLQSRLDDTTKEQSKLEERLHEAEEQIEALTNEKREAARQMREMETIYEAERSSMMKEKEEMGNREEEMQTVIQRLKDSLAAKNSDASEDEKRPSRPGTDSPTTEGGNFAPPSSLQRSDSRNNSKILLQKDKLIESLRLELAEAQIKLVESENQGGGRLQEVERLLMEARMANARLMEDNESYQLLLQERTLNGEFKNNLAYMGAAAANEDALKALEGRNSGTTLADELSEAAENEPATTTADHGRMEAELKSLKEENKALILYIDKTLGKVLGHPEFEAILDQSTAAEKANKNKDLPPPPPEKDHQWSGASIFQRARASMGAAPKPTQRPVSVMPMPTSTVHNNPDTAPKIPIGNLTRSTSVRRSRPMSEQFTGAGAGASGMLANRMGPASPTFSEPRRSQSFFANNPAGSRSPSGQHTAPTSGNFPGMRSETSSMSGESGELATPPSQSPPRHGDKATTFAGNKPRPLRLLQEQEPPKDNKRASWINWGAWGGKKEEATSIAE